MAADKQKNRETDAAGDQPAEPDDAALVERARNGDVAAYDVLVQRYQGRIYSLLYNMTSNRQDAEDLVQEVFVKGYSSLPRFKGDASFYTWIYRIAVNRAINFVKSRKRRQAMSLDAMEGGVERDPAYVELSSGSGPRHEAGLTELGARLNKALQALSEKHRMAVILHDIEGLPHEEVARLMGCSAGTVRSRLFYARRLLQVELKDFEP